MVKKTYKKTTTEKTSSKTLFDHIRAVTEFQDPEYFDKLTDGDKKTWSNYMMQRFLSMNPDWTEFISEMDPIIVGKQLDPKLTYLLYISMIPKSKIFLEYIKGSKSVNYHEKLVELMKKEYEISKEECIEYLNILSIIDEKNIYTTNLLQKYGINEKEISKILLNRISGT
jgi:hypothetical protein